MPPLGHAFASQCSRGFLPRSAALMAQVSAAGKRSVTSGGLWPGAGTDDRRLTGKLMTMEMSRPGQQFWRGRRPIAVTRT